MGVYPAMFVMDHAASCRFGAFPQFRDLPACRELILQDGSIWNRRAHRVHGCVRCNLLQDFPHRQTETSTQRPLPGSDVQHHAAFGTSGLTVGVILPEVRGRCPPDPSGSREGWAVQRAVG